MQSKVSTQSVAVLATDASAPDLLTPGATAGPWVVHEQLGHGGMGTVYAVVHEEIGKRAALKVMHRRLCSGRMVERTLLEARLVNRVGHPNVVDIFETGTLADGRPYIVMERLEGMPLSKRARASKLQPDAVIDILLQVGDGLIAAHTAGVIHRDLKLDNVFLVDDADDPNRPRVKILDWGIAKEIETDAGRTLEGFLLGTPHYLSPEQARGDQLSSATDVYSLGVMAYELFVERLPFEADTIAEIMTMHLRATPPSPRDTWPGIPVALEQLLLAMLAKRASQRPTIQTVVHALELVRDELEQIRGLPAREAKRLVPTPAFAASIDAPARWRRGATSWKVGLGATAMVVSVVGFIITRDTSSLARALAATITAPATSERATPAPHAAPPALAAPAIATTGRTPSSALGITAPLPHRDHATQAAARERPSHDADLTHMSAIAATPSSDHQTMRVHAHVAHVDRNTTATETRQRTGAQKPVQAVPHVTDAVDPDGSIEAYR